MHFGCSDEGEVWNNLHVARDSGESRGSIVGQDRDARGRAWSRHYPEGKGMSETKLQCWREAFHVCMRRTETAPLARHLARLPEGDRSMLLEGIGSDLLRAEVNTVLRSQQEQLALV